ncbi:periplasmic heavy metal sensor, partial [Crocinitomicaceae bacterium]|nr:periplasmic heavy metal sensor [Crocinitomicaceae bacterium]
MRYIFTFLLLIVSGYSIAQIKKEANTSSYLDIHHSYLEEAFILTKNCVGFSAPISGRAYGYLAVGMYESSVPITGLKSLEGQLNEFQPSRVLVDSSELNWGLVLNESNYQIMLYLYRGMPPSNRERLDQLHDSIYKQQARRTRRKVRLKSIQYARAIAKDIIDWSKKDGGDEGYRNNFPEDFEPEECQSCWEKTFPGYLS